MNIKKKNPSLSQLKCNFFKTRKLPTGISSSFCYDEDQDVNSFRVGKTEHIIRKSIPFICDDKMVQKTKEYDKVEESVDDTSFLKLTRSVNCLRSLCISNVTNSAFTPNSALISAPDEVLEKPINFLSFSEVDKLNFSRENIKTHPLENIVHIKHNVQFQPRLEKNKHRTSLIFKPISSNQPQSVAIRTLTLSQLILELTSTIDEGLLTDLLLTYRLFTTSMLFARELIARFQWGLEGEDDQRKITRVRSFVVLRYWITNYYEYDFEPNPSLFDMLFAFLEKAPSFLYLKDSARDLLIIEKLKLCFKEQRMIHIERDDIDSKSQPLTNDSPKTAAQRLNSEKKHHSQPFLCLSTRKGSQSRFNLNLSNQGKMKRTPSQIMVKKISNHPNLSGTPAIITLDLSDNLGKQTRLASMIERAKSSVNNQMKKSVLIKNLDLACKHSFLLRFLPQSIAEQLCLVEDSFLQDVKWYELTEWPKKKKDFLSASDTTSSAESIRKFQTSQFQENGIGAAVYRFNLVCTTIASQINDAAHSPSCLNSLLDHLIKIALHCLSLKNYSSMLQIILGIQSSSPELCFSSESSLGWALLEPYASPLRNWCAIRSVMELQLNMPSTLLSLPPVIPFLGVYLSDVVYNAELPNHLEPNDTNLKSDPIIRFEKFHTLARIIKKIQAYQARSSTYPYIPDTILYSLCLNMSELAPSPA